MPDQPLIASSPGRPGFFGKLPVAGDFLRRGLQPSSLRAIDDWLQSGLGADRADWRLDTARPWRFYAAPGTLGESGLAGVLAASRDRVGRQFPILIAVEVDLGVGVAIAGTSDWFAAVEDLLNRALSGLLTADDLATELAALGALELKGDALVPMDADGRGSIWWMGEDPETVLSFEGHLTGEGLRRLTAPWSAQTNEEGAVC
jgi:type VI secretion system protein ImpM